MIGELPIGIDEPRKLPQERFKNGQEVKDICNAMVLADRRRVPWRASIDGLINGNPTYSLDTLRKKNQAWRARVNYRESEGLLQARQTPFYDMVTEVSPCVEICLDYGKGVNQADWAQKMAANFHWLLMKAWRPSLNYHLPLQQLEMLKHGLGFHIWPGAPNVWIPRTPRTGSILFPENCSVNIHEDLDYFMLRDFLPAYVLYACIRHEEIATQLGWNVEAVWSALAQSSKNKQRADNRLNVETFQREMRRGDIGTTASRQSGLWLNTLFVREFDTGEVSQYTVAETVTVNAPKTGSRKVDAFKDCLFRKRNRFEEWPLVLFPYDIGDGDLHSIRGLGARTKDFFELNNRIRNAMADQVLVGSTLNLKQTGSVDPDKLKLMRLGMMSIIPQGLEAMQGLKFPDLNQGPLALLANLGGTLRENNEAYGGGVPEPKDRETGLSFQLRAHQSAMVGKGSHSLYASNLCQFYERMVRTLARPDAVHADGLSGRLAKEFRRRCEKDGIPDEAFEHIYEVNEVTSTGAGSAAARLDALMTIFKLIYPVTTEDRKINIERDLVSALASASKTDRYARAHDDNKLPDDDMSLAAQENNGLAQGGDAIVSETQNDVAHLELHLPKANEIVQLVMAGGMDPAQGLAAIQKFGQHCAKHLEKLQTNPMRRAEFERLHQEWLALASIADKLQQQVEEFQNAEPQEDPEAAMSDRLKIGLADVERKGRLDDATFTRDTGLELRRLALQERMAKAAGGRNGATATAK